MDTCVDVEDRYGVSTVLTVKAFNDEAVSSNREQTQEDRYNLYLVDDEQPPHEGSKALPVKSSNKEAGSSNDGKAQEDRSSVFVVAAEEPADEHAVLLGKKTCEGVSNNDMEMLANDNARDRETDIDSKIATMFDDNLKFDEESESGGTAETDFDSKIAALLDDDLKLDDESECSFSTIFERRAWVCCVCQQVRQNPNMKCSRCEEEKLLTDENKDGGSLSSLDCKLPQETLCDHNAADIKHKVGSGTEGGEVGEAAVDQDVARLWASLSQELDSTKRRKQLLAIRDIVDEIAADAVKRIVDENFADWTGIGKRIDTSKKTLKQANLGGLAGGTKFIYKGLLFKLAVDPKLSENRYLYGVSKADNVRAAKAAAGELQGVNSYFEAFVEGNIPIQVPFQTIVDYRGFRLVVMPMLPLADSTLVYGSDDGGRTVHNSDTKFSDWMETAGDKLGLAKHKVGKVFLCCGGDVEGHRISTKDRNGNKKSTYYLLDLARWAPPESPLDTPHLTTTGSSIFYRMLRPEFLLHSRHSQLSSDCFSRWGSQQSRMHRSRLREATRQMCSVVVDEVVKTIDQKARKSFNPVDGAAPPFAADVRVPKWPDTLDVPAALHQHGLPMRHLVLVWNRIRDPLVLSRIEAEIVARCIKHQVRSTVLRGSTKEALWPNLWKFVNQICGEGGVESRTNIDLKAAALLYEEQIPTDAWEHFGMRKYFLPDGDWKELGQLLGKLNDGEMDMKSLPRCAAYLKRLWKCEQRPGNFDFSHNNMDWVANQIEFAGLLKAGKEARRKFVSELSRMKFDQGTVEEFYTNLCNQSIDIEKKTTYMIRFPSSPSSEIASKFESLVKDLIGTPVLVSFRDNGKNFTAPITTMLRELFEKRIWQAHLARFFCDEFCWWEAMGNMRGIGNTTRMWGGPKLYQFSQRRIVRTHLHSILQEAVVKTTGIEAAVFQHFFYWTSGQELDSRQTSIETSGLPKVVRMRTKHMNVLLWADLESTLLSIVSHMSGGDKKEETSITRPRLGVYSNKYMKLRRGRSKSKPKKTAEPWFSKSICDRISPLLSSARTVLARLQKSGGAGSEFLQASGFLSLLEDFNHEPRGIFPGEQKRSKFCELDVLHFYPLSSKAILVNAGKKVYRLLEKLAKLFHDTIARSLLRLDLSSRQLAHVEGTIVNLASLTFLKLHGNALKSLPKDIGNLQNLEMIELEDNNLVSLPDEVCNLRSLRRIALDRNLLQSLPDEIGKLSMLRDLAVSENKLTSLPSSIGQCTSLVELWVAENKLAALPESVYSLTYLRELMCFTNKIKSISPSIGKLQNLEKFYAYENKLTTIPRELGQCRRLETLTLQDNQICEIPKEIGQCKRLTTIFLASNQLRSLPKELGALSILEVLQVENNNDIKLPVEIGEIKTLEILGVDEAVEVPTNFINHPICKVDYY